MSATKAELKALYAEIKRLDALRGADQLAVTAALNAAKEAVAAALAASEKAVNKAEINQSTVNAGQNEFRAALKDQAALLMPRAEVESLVRELRLQIEQNATAVRSVAGTQRAEQFGASATSQGWKYLIAAGTLLIGAASVILAVLQLAPK